MRRVEDWLRQAERNLEEARYAGAGGYYELAYFLSQQCAEKAVKALLQFKGIEKRGHMIMHLLDNAPVDIIQCAAFLDKQYIPSRYPDAYDEGAPFDSIVKGILMNA